MPGRFTMIASSTSALTPGGRGPRAPRAWEEALDSLGPIPSQVLVERLTRNPQAPAQLSHVDRIAIGHPGHSAGDVWIHGNSVSGHGS